MADPATPVDRHELRLTGFGVPATPVEAQSRDLTMRDRMVRGAKALGMALLAALIMLPIPIIHIVGPPLALLIGLVMGARRLGEGTIFVAAEGECPFCHTSQRLGLTGSRFRLPVEITCRSCRQPLQLEAAPRSHV